MAIPNPTIEFYGNHTLDSLKSWNEWYDLYEKEKREYSKCRHKAEITDAANQYEL